MIDWLAAGLVGAILGVVGFARWRESRTRRAAADRERELNRRVEADRPRRASEVMRLVPPRDEDRA